MLSEKGQLVIPFRSSESKPDVDSSLLLSGVLQTLSLLTICNNYSLTGNSTNAYTVVKRISGVSDSMEFSPLNLPSIYRACKGLEAKGLISNPFGYGYVPSRAGLELAQRTSNFITCFTFFTPPSENHQPAPPSRQAGAG